VWRAHHLTLNSPVAIKLIDPALAGEGIGRERFMREAQAAAALRSPHVVETLDYGVHEGIPYIAMELMEGETLAARLRQAERLSPAETAKLITQVGRAVSKAHDLGIVHRDLKPDNIFIVRNDDEDVAKVLDFGIAKLTGSSMQKASETRTGAVMGTPYYMSPEQAEGIRALDHRTDIWAIGVITYECLTGVRPFQGESMGDLILRICTRPIPVPSEVAPVPRGFDEWFAKACCRDLTERFPNVRQMTDALRALTVEVGTARASGASEPAVVEEPMDRTAAPLTETVRQQQPSRRTPVLLAVGFGVLALGGAVSYALFATHGEPVSPANSAGLGAATVVSVSALTPRQVAAPAAEPQVVQPAPELHAEQAAASASSQVVRAQDPSPPRPPARPARSPAAKSPAPRLAPTSAAEPTAKPVAAPPRTPTNPRSVLDRR